MFVYSFSKKKKKTNISVYQLWTKKIDAFDNLLILKTQERNKKNCENYNKKNYFIPKKKYIFFFNI